MAFVHEGKPLAKSEQKEDDRPKANKEKQFSNPSNLVRVRMRMKRSKCKTTIVH